MKNHPVVNSLLIIILWGTFSLGQVPKEPFDLRKSQEELEIMKGILNTTISFVVQNLSKQGTTAASGNQGAWITSWRVSNIDGVYLAGQGAVFLIPTSVLRHSNFASLPGTITQDWSGQMEAYGKEIDSYANSLASVRAQATLARLGQGEGGPAPSIPATPVAPMPPVPPAPPVPPVPPSKAQEEVRKLNQEELRKKVEGYQKSAKKTREEAEANREKFLQSLAEAKGYLLEALANYGDSMTTIRPNEYINLVLVHDDSAGLAFGAPGQKTRHEVISAQKSWIIDYKAGRLSLDAFKQKVLHYSE